MTTDEPIKTWPREMFEREDAAHSGTTGSIQWKGTGVCMDVHCRCGYHAHVDCEFLYFYQCPQCLEKFAVGCTVQMYRLDGEALDRADGSGSGVVRPDLEAPDGTVIAEGNDTGFQTRHRDDEHAALVTEMRTYIDKLEAEAKRLDAPNTCLCSLPAHPPHR